jgi:hypothetical protein
MKASDSTKESKTPSRLISDQSAELSDWRGPFLARLRQLILETVVNIKEEVK